MKAAVFYGPRDVRFEEIDKPSLSDGEVLLKVKACGICGSDLHTYRHGMFLDLGTPVESGRVLGHEFSGEVVATGGEVEIVADGGAGYALIRPVAAAASLLPVIMPRP